MNDRQAAFCRGIAAGSTLEKAYVEAGYAVKGARQAAYKLLTHAHIQDEVARLQAILATKVEISKEWLINKNREVLEMAIEQKKLGDAVRSLSEISKLTGHYAPLRQETTLTGGLAVNATEATATDWAALRAAHRAREKVIN